MRELIKEDGKLKYKTQYGTETIHLSHCGEELEDIKEDIWSPYMVAEEVSNFARLHLITAESEQHALEQVDEYIRENETDLYNEDGYSHLICANELTIK